jgi:hypothetical protein
MRGDGDVADQESVSVVDDPSESAGNGSGSGSVRERLDATLGPELAAMLVSALSGDLLRRGPRDVDAAGELPPPES